MVPPNAPLVLGSLLDLTGPLASTDTTNAVVMATEKQSVGGHPVQLVSRSDGCSGPIAAQGAAQLAAVNVVGVIGTACSGAAIQADGVLAPLGITLFSPSSTNPSLTAPGSALPFFARAFNDNAQPPSLATFARDGLGVSRVAIIVDSATPYSVRLAEGFAAASRSLGLIVTTMQSVDCSAIDCNVATNFQSTLDKIVTAGARDLIFAPLVNGAAAFIKAVRSRPELASSKLMGPDSLANQSVIRDAGPAAEGIYVGGVPAATPSFALQFVERFGTNPGPYSAIAFDETNILLAAVNSVLAQDGTGANSTLFIPRSALYAALLTTSGYAGTAGTYTCAEAGFNVGDCLNHPVLAVYQVQNGAFVQVFPVHTLSVSTAGKGRVTSTPPGISCPTTCTATFLEGTKVALAATAASGYRFAGWNGACSGKGACVLTINATAQVTATFTRIPVCKKRQRSTKTHPCRRH
jgi:ABC-type branched-subunit amino acid transport system substrate-binding protein